MVQKEPRELIAVSGFGAGQAGWAQARLPEPMAALRFTLPLIGPGATAAASRLGIEIKTRRGCCSLLRGGVRIAWGKPRGSGNTPEPAAAANTDRSRGSRPISRFSGFLSFVMRVALRSLHTPVSVRASQYTHTHARYSRSFLYRSFFRMNKFTSRDKVPRRSQRLRSGA
jgi:hypothetical protein